MDIGRAIRYFRIARDMTQAELASACGSDSSYISLIEQGKRNVSQSMLERVSSAFGVPPLYLIYLADENKDQLPDEVAVPLSHAVIMATGKRSNKSE